MNLILTLVTFLYQLAIHYRAHNLQFVIEDLLHNPLIHQKAAPKPIFSRRGGEVISHWTLVTLIPCTSVGR